MCGHVWNVSVEKTEDGLLFIREGWEDFINYHYVKGGYFLIFRYEEDSSFTVKVLGSNGCKEWVPIAIENIEGRDSLIYS